VRISTAGFGGIASIQVCYTGNPEEVRVDAPSEVAFVSCLSGSGTAFVRAIAARPVIELRKTVLPSSYTQVIALPTGTAAYLGSPAVADPNNTEPIVVHILDPNGDEVGTYTLDPGESAEATIPAPGVLAIQVFSGNVIMTVQGQTTTADEGQTQTFAVPIPDTLAPNLSVPANFSVQATSPAGVAVTWAATATDDAEGPITPSCSPASGSIFPVGNTVVLCMATDSHGNTSTKTFVVTVNDVTTPGEMTGDGLVVKDHDRYHFNFFVAEGTRHNPGNRFELRVDYEPHMGMDSKGEPRMKKEDDGRFVASAFTFVAFSDDPSFRPGRSPKPQVDTVLFSGTGKWNGQAGYAFEVKATDQGEPGRRHETVAIAITRNADGQVVATISGYLSGGNIQSVRLKH